MSISQQVKALEDRIKFLEESLASERKKGYKDALKHFECKTKFIIDGLYEILYYRDDLQDEDVVGMIWAMLHQRMIEESNG
jgi:hypothetical protein